MNIRILIAAIAAAGFASSAFATNGYFSHGYGIKAKGMGGAATASSNDTFGGANNPASMVWVGDRVDLGADLFSPQRSASRAGTGMGGLLDGSVKSEDEYFLVPEFGYNKMYQPNLSLGVSVYGNGGMNTDYPTGSFTCMADTNGDGTPDTPYAGNVLCGGTDAGVDLSQLIIAPTVAYKINDRHSVGISPLLVYQRFSAYGVDLFGMLSSNPARLTNQGYDDSTGLGVRIGWMGKLSDQVTLGAAYASKVNMSKFGSYKGLFAGKGDFDIPENYNLGISVQATPQLRVAVDYQRINYSGVNSVSNPSGNAMFPDGSGALGQSKGAGFGWDDVDVFKLGAEYQYSKNLVLRAGYNHGNNPIRAADVTFNILAPGVIEDHLTLGFSYETASGGELSMAYMHAFENSVKGASFFNAVLGTSTITETIKMYQDSLGIAYSWKL